MTHRATKVPPTPPPREHCPICDSAIPHDAIHREPARRGCDAYGAYTLQRITLHCPFCDRKSVVEICSRDGITAAV